MAAQRLMRASRVRLDQCDQRCPGHDLVHLVKEGFLAGLLGQRVKAQRDLIHDLHHPLRSRPAPVGMTRGFADLP
jgi:hypothetical protein